MTRLAPFALLAFACDGVDNDNDDDGYEVGVDCNDVDATIYPGADEICDAKDNDCNGAIDDNPVDPITLYLDADKDGYGDVNTSTVVCFPQGTGVEQGGDCDDASPTVHPGAVELCNDIDDDCDPSTGEEGVVSTATNLFSDLQTAVESAAAGGTVFVCGGNHTLSADLNKGIALIGMGAGPQDTVIDSGVAAGETGSVLSVRPPTGDDARVLTVKNVTIQGGRGTFYDEFGLVIGGGIAGYGATSMVLEDVILRNNRANFGAGVLGPSSGVVTMKNTLIEDNVASQFAGGAYVFGGEAAVLEGVVVRGNTGPGVGGIYLVGGATFDDVVIEGNSSSTTAGGIIVEAGTVTMTGGAIRDNEAADVGGALLVSPATLDLVGVDLGADDLDNAPNDLAMDVGFTATGLGADTTTVCSTADLGCN